MTRTLRINPVAALGMLAEWLTLTLEGTAPRQQTGRLPHARFAIHAPGVLELTPDEPRPGARACVLSAGIHGNETAPIELVGELLALLEAGLLQLGAPTLVLLGNIPALRAGQRFLATNLNRLFYRAADTEGATTNGADDEPQRARELMTAIDVFYARHGQPRLHYDLHTAIRDSRYPLFAVEPYADTLTDNEQWRWLAAAGIQAVLHQHRHSWTFSHYSRHYHNAQAFTLELGKVHAFGDNDLATLRPMRGLLEALLEGREPMSDEPAGMAFFQVEHELMRQADDFQLCFVDDTPNFTEFGNGTQLAADAIAGDFVVGPQPLAVVFPNARVEIGARAALLVRPVAPPPASAE